MDIKRYSYKQDYIKKKTLGIGAYGKVYKVAHKNSGSVYAVKVFIDDDSVIEEINALLMLEHHKNILYPVGIYSYKKTAVVLPYVKHSLYRWYKTHDYNRKIIRIIVFQLLEALYYTHTIGIVHRDVKPTNVLISLDVIPRVYLIDFGMSKIFAESDGGPADHCVQTSSYRSPELYAGRNDYSTEIDIWALGCLMAELFLRTSLFGVCDTQIITNQWRLATPPITNYPEYITLPKFRSVQHLISDGIQHHTSLDDIMAGSFGTSVKYKMRDLAFMSTMLNLHYGSRPSAVQLLQSPYFSDVTCRIVPKQKIVWLLSGQSHVRPYLDDTVLRCIYDSIIAEWFTYNRAHKHWISLYVALDMFNRVVYYYHVDRVKCPFVIYEMMGTVCLHIAQMITTEKKLLAPENTEQFQMVAREVAAACGYRVIVPTTGHFLHYMTRGNCSDSIYATGVIMYLTGPHEFSTVEFLKSLLKGACDFNPIRKRYRRSGWYKHRNVRYLYNSYCLDF